MADYLWTGEIDGKRHADAPGTEGVGDTGELAEHLRLKRVEVGVDIIDGTAVKADGGKEATVLGGSGEVRADVASVEEDGTSGIAALDGAVHVVPLIDPAYGCRGRLGMVGERVLLRDLLEQVKDAIEFSAVVSSGDHPKDVALCRQVGDSEALRSE